MYCKSHECKLSTLATALLGCCSMGTVVILMQDQFLYPIFILSQVMKWLNGNIYTKKSCCYCCCSPFPPPLYFGYVETLWRILTWRQSELNISQSKMSTTTVRSHPVEQETIFWKWLLLGCRETKLYWNIFFRFW